MGDVSYSPWVLRGECEHGKPIRERTRTMNSNVEMGGHLSIRAETEYDCEICKQMHASGGLQRKRQPKGKIGSLLIQVSKITAIGLPVIGGIILFVEYEHLRQTVNTWEFIYVLAAVVFGSMFLAVFLRGFVEPRIWMKLPIMFGVCVASAIVYVIVVVVAILVLLVPALIAMMFGSDIFDKILEWGGIAGLFLVVLADWIICLILFFGGMSKHE